ncbi:hypothetical protein M3611_23625 [Priestia megaterium]|uniref:hypothetical protein n=1 Tax=Priestia megaterium TaxID=1404 RepID=UPI00203D12F6|nr:hypothetical protein [Priestia megaterium]MCM3155005.1 hypothetical protein [Priestia megaterium]
MDDQTKAILLELLKLDLGFKHTARDTYLNKLLPSAEKELIRKGLVLDMSQDDDQMLVVDYAAWLYRNRQEYQPLPRNIQIRIHNRAIQKAGTPDV